MAAGINDRFTRTFNATNPNVARVDADRVEGGTTLTCDNLAGWPDDTAVHFSTFRVDSMNEVIPGSQVDWKGIVAGDVIGTLTRVAGASDHGNSIGDIVMANPTASWADDVIRGLLQSHDQDGSLKENSVTSDSIKDGEVTSPKIKNAGSLFYEEDVDFYNPISATGDTELSGTSGEIVLTASAKVEITISARLRNTTSFNVRVYARVGSTVYRANTQEAVLLSQSNAMQASVARTFVLDLPPGTHSVVLLATRDGGTAFVYQPSWHAKVYYK